MKSTNTTTPATTDELGRVFLPTAADVAAYEASHTDAGTACVTRPVPTWHRENGEDVLAETGWREVMWFDL